MFATSLAHAQAVEPSVTGKGTVGCALLGAEAVMLTEAAFKVRPGWAYYLGGGAGLIGGGVAGYFLEDSLDSKSAMYLLSAGMLLAIPTTVAALNATSYDTPLEYTQDVAPIDEGADEPITTVAPTPLPTMPPANTAPVEQAPPATGDAPPPAPSAAPPAAPAPAPASTPAPGASPAATPETAPKTERTRKTQWNRAVAHWRAAPVNTPPALVDFSGRQLALGLPAVEIHGTYTRREVAMYGVKQQTEVRVPLFQMMF
jgi:hypothetical protein